MSEIVASRADRLLRTKRLREGDLMWPGPDPPSGTPPGGRDRPGAFPARRIVRPGAGWYALPACLALLAIAGYVTVAAFLWDDSRAADGPPGAGDPVTGVPVQLSRGHGYFVYVRAGRPSPFACTIEAGGRVGYVRLTRQNSWGAGERPGFRYTATFESPVTGKAAFRCGGTDGPIVVTPDDTADTYLRLTALASAGLAAAAVVLFAVTFLRRALAGRAAGRAETRFRT
ncbi:MAG TPA: hypothetical protein VKY91_22945 [Vulgatibacteraceae bacterium]|nr:hypothetical protein [Vulgatibacteraceae bacterium]